MVSAVQLVSDKLIHAGVYGSLMIWFAGLYRRQLHWVIAILLFLLGFGLDWLQSLTPYRSFEMADVAANTGGILAALILSRFVFEGWCLRVERLLARK